MKTILLFMFTLFTYNALAIERTVTLSVDNMTCALCPITVKKSLEEVEGVLKASASYDDKTATIVFDDEKTNIGDLIDATTFAGYPSSLSN